MDAAPVISALNARMPSVLRWAGAVARQMRKFDIGIEGKTSGSASTDALTLADLTVQELIVSALRDSDPVLLQCRLEAEESTGDTSRFATDSPLTLAIDPIDGTRFYRERSGHSWGVILLLRTEETVLWSLVILPDSGPTGTWVHAADNRVLCGPDDPSRPAEQVLAEMEPVNPADRSSAKKIYVIGFQDQDQATAEAVTAAGLEGFAVDAMPASIFELQARGEFAGSLIHSPNVYDFPVSLQIARILGGDAVWVHDRQPVHFRELWMDDRADMLRLPGICACSEDPAVVDTLCTLAADWPRERYRD
ncbi:MAG: inositol monophosphatase [Planctomycetaceae bacterium]|nr:inositol monophosphatase [Planctomycetaceae bacterium]